MCYRILLRARKYKYVYIIYMKDAEGVKLLSLENEFFEYFDKH